MNHRQLILLFSLLCCFSLFGNANPTDSLLYSLGKVTTPSARFQLYRNLADVNKDYPSEVEYLRRANEELLKYGTNAQKVDMLCDLAYYYVDKKQSDSLQHCQNELEQLADSEERRAATAYLDMSLFKLLFSLNKSSEGIDREMKQLGANDERSLYSRIASGYIVAYAIYKEETPAAPLPYIEQAYKLAQQLPPKEGYRIRIAVMRSLAYYYMVNSRYKEALSLTEEIIQIQDAYYQKYIRPLRPFYNNDSFFLAESTTLVACARMVAQDRLPNFVSRILPMLSRALNSRDKYNGFLALNNYYLHMNDASMALATNDSLIKYAWLVMPENLAGLYKISSQIYEVTGNYKRALSTLKTSFSIRDSLNNFAAQEKLGELQVKYDLDKLNYEKSQLEVKNKRTWLICLTIFLAVAVTLCLYLYYNLKKERMMKTRMRELKSKAEESEKMKSSFINSICHEIRTPLNSIVGFTDLILDESIDDDLRQTFPEEIQKNTALLTSLIGSMLEVSNLDVSDEKLPCTPFHIKPVCEHEIDRIRQSGKPHLEYRLDIPQEDIVINAHEHYLSLVLEQLLNNSSKFTESGHVTLHYHVEAERGLFVLTVSDTGCGIPAEKHKEVFERFMKIDDYVPGNGLGLYLSQLIVSRLGGEICIDPQYNDGTSVIITLPL